MIPANRPELQFPLDTPLVLAMITALARLHPCQRPNDTRLSNCPHRPERAAHVIRLFALVQLCGQFLFNRRRWSAHDGMPDGESNHSRDVTPRSATRRRHAGQSSFSKSPATCVRTHDRRASFAQAGGGLVANGVGPSAEATSRALRGSIAVSLVKSTGTVGRTLKQHSWSCQGKRALVCVPGTEAGISSFLKNMNSENANNKQSPPDCHSARPEA